MKRELEIPRVLFDSQSATQPSGQCDCDCDCACELFTGLEHYSRNKTFAAMLAASRSFHRSDFYTLNLSEEYIICYNTLQPPAVLNQSAFNLLCHFDQSLPRNIPTSWLETWGNQVIQFTLEKLLILGLLAPKDFTPPRPPENSTILSAWLHITDRCNLRCSYCYLPHDPVDMTIETGRAAIDATYRSAMAHNYRQVKLKYAGGEATLRFPFIVELHQYAQNLANRHGLNLNGVILSNGTRLTPEMIKTMQSLKLRLMISLDSLGDYHDSQRFYANMRDSSNDVMQAVELALDHGFVPDISITVSGRNAEGLPLLIEWLLERDLPFSLNFYRENELSIAYEDLKLEEEKIIAGMMAAFRVIEANLPDRNLLASLVDRANLSAAHVRTCSVGDSYLVFDYLGQVSKCQMQMNKPITTAKAKDPLALIRADKLGIQNLSVEEKEGCRDCEWKYWCTGGCPLATYRATGRYDVKSPNCNIYKTLYPEAVRLEGLRLLKYADKFDQVN